MPPDAAVLEAAPAPAAASSGSGAALLTLPAYEQAYVEELYNRLHPAAVEAYGSYFYERTRASWQTQMQAYVQVTGEVDSALPAYERAYVREQYLYLRVAAEAAYASYILERTPWDWQAEMALLVTAGSPVDLYEYVDAVINDGGTVSPARRTLIQNFIAAEKNSGVWEKTDDYWVFWGENETQALISLKIGRRAVPAGSPLPAFTVDRGYLFNGTTNYINSLFIPQFMRQAMTPSDCRLAVYARADVNAVTYDFALIAGTNRILRLNTRTGTTARADLNGTGLASFTLPVATAAGYTAVSRNGLGLTDTAGYKNGVLMAKTTNLTAVNNDAMADVSLFFGAYNSAGAPVSNRAASLGFACVGASLTAAQELAQYNAVQAFATAVGAQV